MYSKMKDALKQTLFEILAMDEEKSLKEAGFSTINDSMYLHDWLINNVKLSDWPIRGQKQEFLQLPKNFTWKRIVGYRAYAVYFKGETLPLADIYSVYGIEGLKFSGDYFGKS